MEQKNKISGDKAFIILMLPIILSLVVFLAPITAIKCDKINNKCEITQNFLIKHNTALFDINNESILVYIDSINGYKSRHDYDIVIKTPYSSHPFAHYKYKHISYDITYRSFLKLKDEFNNFISNESELIYKKIHIPFIDKCLFLFLIIYMFIPIKDKEPYIGFVFFFVLLYVCINSIISTFLH